MKTTKNENKKNFIGNIKASFSGRKFRSGAYATILSVVVIIIVLVVNMLVSKMNIQFDLSSQSMYTLTQDTKDYVKDLKDDITIYYMVQQGNETSEFDKISKLYDSLSKKITVVEKDPLLYPAFSKTFVDDDITQNSFIVVNNTNKRAKYIAGSDMLVTEMDYQTYQSKTTGIDVEGKLTSAIQYVTTDKLPTMYEIDGHGETASSDTFKATLAKMNIELKTLSTLSQSTMPEDCDLLYINAPQKDFSDDETKMIKDYLTKGGKAIITLDFNASTLTNFLSILDYYGIEMVNGIVEEGDSNHFYAGHPDWILPTIESHDITTKVEAGNIPAFLPISSGLILADTTRSSLKVEPLFTTSDSSYSMVNAASTATTKEDGDIDGPFNLGLVATDTYNNVTSNIVVFSSAYTFTDDTADYGNTALLTGTVGFLSGDKGTLSIPTKSYNDSMLVTTQLQFITWGGFVALGIPLIIIIFGGVICYRRRRK